MFSNAFHKMNTLLCQRLRIAFHCQKMLLLSVMEDLDCSILSLCIVKYQFCFRCNQCHFPGFFPMNKASKYRSYFTIGETQQYIDNIVIRTLNMSFTMGNYPDRVHPYEVPGKINIMNCQIMKNIYFGSLKGGTGSGHVDVT
ncbi:hypothetical protein SDC9_204582 [bioreactor metagenome]|uniref:Uncharacterized protein n=1 Tax=bioreactor metagenome TaxID=1076179 RepID=A0A645J2F3_9ZZZZ